MTLRDRIAIQTSTLRTDLQDFKDNDPEFLAAYNIYLTVRQMCMPANATILDLATHYHNQPAVKDAWMVCEKIVKKRFDK